jgi:hypothetical protein
LGLSLGARWLRDRKQRAYYEDRLQLEHALGRAVWEIDIMDTIGDEVVPADVVRQGPERVADWATAVEIRRELERLTFV